ncbi:MAG: hypothetical protein LBV12_06255 [Puniceicoccales bacterium]|jgi:hypothetical protein|nr:hypothetical protein [Puniceicoccales bacterium]
MEALGGILALISPLMFCIMLAMGLYRWKWGVVALFLCSAILVIIAALPLIKGLERKTAVDRLVGKPFAEGNVVFSKNNLTADIPINRSFLHDALKVFSEKAPVGIQFTPANGTIPPETTHKWNFSWVYSDGSTSTSCPVSVESDPQKQKIWLYTISSSLDYENATILRIEETDIEANYSGKLSVFFTGDGIERIGQQFAMFASIYLLVLALVLGIGGISGSVKKEWKNKALT